MKNIIDKNKTKKIQNKSRITDGTMISDGTLISNTFNEFFVNVGPNLAKKIPNQNISPRNELNISISGDSRGNKGNFELV